MDLYLLFKFLHVASAVIWVGAGFVMLILGVAADRTTNKDDFLRVIGQLVYLTPRLFIPSSLAVLVLGVIAAFFSYGFDSLWIALGFIGWASTFSTGLFLIKPRSDRIAAMTSRGGVSDQAIATGRELLQISKFDYVMLFTVIADMVFKPTAGDWLVLLLMAVAIVAGAVAFLLPTFQARQAAAA